MKERLIGRRDFMKSTVAGMGGFVYLSSNEKGDKKQQKERKIIYRTLGKTGIKLPVISMGVMNADNPNLVRSALDNGIVHLDTAHIYQRGQNERMIGDVLKGRPRDSYVIATKVQIPKRLKEFLFPSERATEETLFEQLDKSLKRLGLEYVDILYNHDISGRKSALFEPILKAMGKAKSRGKTRFVGVSTHSNEPEVIQAAIDSKIYDVILTSCNFRQKHSIQVREAVAKAAQAGLGIVAMKVMGGTVNDNSPGAKNTAAALKWVLRDPNIHTSILGFTTFDQMNMDLAVMDNLSLTDSERKDLQIEASVPGLYCQGCGQCVHQCYGKLPIPDLMRAYMYTYGYRQSALAKDLVVSLDLPRQICEDCSLCPVKCVNGWNIAGKIRDIIRLRDVPPEFLA